MNFFNSLGVIDISLISDADLAALDDDHREVLTALIEAVLTKGHTEASYRAARERVRTAMTAEIALQALAIAANPPMTALQALRISQQSYRDHH